MEIGVEEFLTCHRAKTNDPYWGLDGEPTRGEIQAALDNDNLVPWVPGSVIGHGEDSQKHHTDRAWHVGRIAWLVKNWNPDEYPVRIDGGKLANGLHRLLAAKFLGLKKIPAVEKSND